MRLALGLADVVGAGGTNLAPEPAALVGRFHLEVTRFAVIEKVRALTEVLITTVVAAGIPAGAGR